MARCFPLFPSKIEAIDLGHRSLGNLAAPVQLASTDTQSVTRNSPAKTPHQFTQARSDTAVTRGSGSKRAVTVPGRVAFADLNLEL